MLTAVVLAVPVGKVAWDVGGGEATWEVLTALGPADWPDILIGMVLTNAPLAAVLAVIASRMVYAYFAARSAASPHGRDTASQHGDDTDSPHGPGWRAVAWSVLRIAVNPLATAVLIAVFFGPWWGLATGAVSLALRQGVTFRYRTRRVVSRPRATWQDRVAAGERWVTGVLAGIVLPVTALVGALDGRSWSPVLQCTVDSGHGAERARLIELGRKGNGVVGWDLEAHEVVNGLACGNTGTLAVREPWWRS
ncbi:hypothetical protein STRAU_0770 [Streptomyces aurantiacus JA 4570]|uniref:Uncharacterized protein n=2 Tax=Streptomyces aurantiacus TaxID=47760 RepID=S4AXL5_9ACTN|nr:hypothetical protein STRAU_0770 [Streptomyces aurantiacus JA 4570]